jgi:predicted ATPase
VFKQITLSHFKSVRDEVTIDLGRLTVMTGSNSSGKSTVLQSLLLLAQTLRHSGTDRHLVLNGPLARLGELSDVVNPKSGPAHFGIGLRIEPPRPTTGDTDTPGNILQRTQTPNVISVHWTFTDRAAHSDLTGQEARSFPSVNTFDLAAEYQPDGPEPIAMRVTRHRWRPETRLAREGYGFELSDALLNSLAWSVDVDYRDSLEPHEGPRKDARGVIFDHFLPRQIATRVDVVQAVASFGLRSFRRSMRPQGAFDKFSVGATLWHLMVEHAIVPASIQPPDFREDDPSWGEVRDWIEQLTRVERRSFTRELALSIDHILNVFKKNHEPQYVLAMEDLPSLVDRGLVSLRSELASVRYLGPLRIQPAPLYPVATTLGSEDVGPSGEWTASVLDTYKDKQVSHLPPSGLPFHEDSLEFKTERLALAVNDWMRYLGVSEGVQTVDRGSLGHELTVHARTSDHGLPLTHVGVGVSQCLPVVVSLLLARPNTITLLEQPELHLHPAVQSRLADFLLAMSLSGRQCLVETHSEYLVNRLRLRIAEASGTGIRDSIRIYFASIRDRASYFEALEVNEYGTIVNWPSGFFDEAQDDIEGLLKASAAKRAKRRASAGRS